MLRRLYFLLPDEAHTKTIVDELNLAGISKSSIHVLANEQHELKNLPRADWGQSHDLSNYVESTLWHGNLWLFFIALALFVASIISGNYYVTISMLVLMLISFLQANALFPNYPTHTSIISPAPLSRATYCSWSTPPSTVPVRLSTGFTNTILSQS